MRRWGVVLGVVAGVLLAGAALVVVFEPTGIALGVLRGERFHRFRPASYSRKLLKEDGGDLRLETLVWFVHPTDTARKVLAEALADPDADVRRAAARHLGELGPNASTAIPELARALEDADPGVRTLALRSLGLVGRQARGVLPEVVARLEDPDPYRAATARRAYWGIDPEGARERFGWQPVESARWGFRAVMPPGVKEKEIWEGPLDGEELPEPVTAFQTLWEKTTMYSVSVLEPTRFGEGGELLEGEALLEYALDRLRARPLMHLIGERRVEHGGSSIVELTHQMDGEPKVFVRVRTYCRGRRVYNLVVAGLGEDVASAEAAYFFESLELRP